MPFMKLEDAIEIVVSLASENVLEECEVSQDPEILAPEREKQLTAIALVQEFFVSNAAG